MLTKQGFKILNMHCTSCAMLIDGELEDTEGVKESNTNFTKGITEVSFDMDKISPRKIIEVVKKAGYLAQIKQS